MLIIVYGRPRPKGSMRSFGKGRMVEQVEGSGDWRANVYGAARRVKLNTGWTYPRPTAVEVYVKLFFDPPQAKHPRRPTTRTSGDIDKLLRNILDALTDAGVVQDDSQVVKVGAEKYYCGESSLLAIPGACITITEAI